MAPSTAPWRNVTATWIEPAQVPLLRRLAYALPHATIAQARMAMTTRGAFVRSSAGIEAIPLGTFFVEVHPNLYVPAGHEVTPAVAPDVLSRALGAPAGQVLFLGTDARAVAVEEARSRRWRRRCSRRRRGSRSWPRPSIARWRRRTLDLKVTSIGMLPLRGVEAPAEEAP